MCGAVEPQSIWTATPQQSSHSKGIFSQIEYSQAGKQPGGESKLFDEEIQSQYYENDSDSCSQNWTLFSFQAELYKWNALDFVHLL